MNKDIELLVKKSKEGHLESKEELLNRFKPYIIKKAREIYIKNYDIDDLIQIGNLSIIKAIDKYNLDKGNFVSYVTFSISNNFNYEIRKMSKTRYDSSLNKVIDDNLEIIDIVAWEENIEENFIRKEKLNNVRIALNKLNEGERNLIYNIYFADIKLKEYASKEGIKYGSALKRKTKILNKLREILKANMIYK